MAVFWVFVLWSLAEVYQHFQASETSLNFYHIKWHNNPEDSQL
jgi:hypothetical protein